MNQKIPDFNRNGIAIWEQTQLLEEGGIEKEPNSALYSKNTKYPPYPNSIMRGFTRIEPI